MTIISDYLSRLFQKDTRVELIANVVELIRPHSHTFDVIAVTGMSGTLLAFLVADALDKPVTLVRKDSDSTHSTEMVEGYHPTITEHVRVLFLDDLIDTGSTVRRVVSTLDHQWGWRRWDLVGAAMWRHNTFYVPKSISSPQPDSNGSFQSFTLINGAPNYSVGCCFTKQVG